ncbi:MAG: DUF2851 family protein [Ktedonobacteraceae bacterium]|nr:DUF2851 family protein [Ktedonobacteraceae bacterium]
MDAARLCPYEEEVARRWWNLSPGCLLLLNSGERLRLLYAGRPGGSSGPDVRDAVLSCAGPSPAPFARLPIRQPPAMPAGAKLAGDIEFHTRASEWFVHRHHSDPRYNNVILHVVLMCDEVRPAQRQDGVVVPTCSLYDLPLATGNEHEQPLTWPCHTVMQRLDEDERRELLRQAGLLRFELKAQTFVEQLHMAGNMHDHVLIPALAESLGYGRDRAFFRAAGYRLLGLPVDLPELLGRMAQPPPLDARRLRALGLLTDRWHEDGAWQTLRALLLSPAYQDTSARLRVLRSLFCTAGVGLARADIIIVNVVLPFALAVALIEHDSRLAAQAHELYTMHPGLPSNQITRAMCTLLRLPTEPAGSCRQQGLHYIYQQTCREKRCDTCVIGKRDI